MIMYADSSRLAAILSVDANHVLEPIPQPFRLQSNLTVVVQYKDYIEFLKSSDAVDEFLYLPRVEALEAPHTAFLMDIARAVAKECYFAVRDEMAPTRIRHVFNDIDATACSVPWRNFSDAFNSYMDRLGFMIPSTNSLIAEEWAYACSLCATAKTAKAPLWNAEI